MQFRILTVTWSNLTWTTKLLTTGISRHHSSQFLSLLLTVHKNISFTLSAWTRHSLETISEDPSPSKSIQTRNPKPERRNSGTSEGICKNAKWIQWVKQGTAFMKLIESTAGNSRQLRNRSKASNSRDNACFPPNAHDHDGMTWHDTTTWNVLEHYGCVLSTPFVYIRK